MSKYFRVSAGRAAQYLQEAIDGGWIGVGWLSNYDLTHELPENWREFNAKWVPILVEESGLSPVGAGLGAGMTWTVSRGIKEDDLVLVPTGTGSYKVARVTGDYFYEPNHELSHRRPVEWLEREISRDELSEELKRPLKFAGTVMTLGHSDELDSLLRGERSQMIQVADEDVESPLSFVLEQHLEDFLASNWQYTELGKDYDIYVVDGEQVGQQYQTDIGRIDILAQSKKGDELLVVELKRGRVSDRVVGQVLRYMGYVQELEPTKKVRGIIIGTEDDAQFKFAISMVPNLDFLKYEVTFKLIRA